MTTSWNTDHLTARPRTDSIGDSPFSSGLRFPLEDPAAKIIPLGSDSVGFLAPALRSNRLRTARDRHSGAVPCSD